MITDWPAQAVFVSWGQSSGKALLDYCPLTAPTCAEQGFTLRPETVLLSTPMEVHPDAADEMQHRSLFESLGVGKSAPCPM